MNRASWTRIQHCFMQFAFVVSQFTKRLESYGGVTTDHICCDTTPTGCCRCKLHETVAGNIQMQCCDNVNDYQDSFESGNSTALRESSKDDAKVKDSISSDLQGNFC